MFVAAKWLTSRSSSSSFAATTSAAAALIVSRPSINKMLPSAAAAAAAVATTHLRAFSSSTDTATFDLTGSYEVRKQLLSVYFLSGIIVVQ